MLKFMLILILMMFMKNKTINNMNMFMLVFLFNVSLQDMMVSKISYMMMGDLISFWITNMSTWIIFIMMFINMKKMSIYTSTLIILLTTLMATFYNWNFLMFYILFEMSMIIMLIIIISWGYQPERMEAMMFMIMMTLIFSLPFFMTMMINYKILNFWFLNLNLNLMGYMSFMLIFMVKAPMYFIHLWLPKVHVEAPVHGSMILAAIMLKLGCYGMIRMNNLIFKFMSFNLLILTMSMWAMLILSMNCMIQIDIKTLIAYSSVVHMMTVIMNILMFKNKSIMSSMLIILGHGMCSASLFFITSIIYKSSKSRSLILNKSIMVNSPALATLWFLTCMNNAPMPPSINMMGEIMSLKNILNWANAAMPLMFMITFLSSMYSIYLFYLPKQGKPSKNINKSNLLKSTDIMIIMILTVPITLITIKPIILYI